MLRRGLASGVGLSTIIIAIAMFITSCTPKITEQQLAQLKQLREKESSLNEQISKKRNEKSALEKELQSRKSEQQQCQGEADYIKKKLANWPNVWPDWTPAPPAEEEKK